MPYMRLRSTITIAVLAAACNAVGPSSQSNNVDEQPQGESVCKPTRIMLVVDASASMTEVIDAEEGTLTKWEAVAGSVHEVLASHRQAAQFGLMTFPGAAGGCAAGDVTVEMDVNTAVTIDDAIAAMSIADNATTPAGQTLMAAASYEKLIDPAYDNYVVFISDGWQYCSLESDDGSTRCASDEDAAAMGMEGAPSCNAEDEGCYCVRSWPVLGVEALKAAGVTTYVVGFGDNVDAQTLNRAAVAGGAALPDCDADADAASCYLKADSGGELSAVLGKIMHHVTTEECPGGCNIEGQRTCTLQGWSACVAPDSVPCSADCGPDGVQEGTQSCVNDQLSECSVQCSGSGGAGGSAPAEGGSQAEGGQGGTSVVDPNPDPNLEDGEDPWDPSEDDDPYYDEDDYDDGYDDDYDDDDDASEGPKSSSGNNEAEGGCSISANEAGSDGGWLVALLAIALGALRRRRVS